MSSIYDNWERLVQATLRREHDREIAYCESFSSRASDFSSTASDFSFESFREHVASGTQEHISELMSSGHKHNKKKKKKQLQTVSLKVRMDCEGCERKVKNALSNLKGVKSVDIDRRQQRVTVTGYVEQNKVLKKAKSTGKKAEIWPYAQYNLVVQPYAPLVPGLVRKVDDPPTTGSVTKFEVPYIAMFGDDNPNACSIM